MNRIFVLFCNTLIYFISQNLSWSEVTRVQIVQCTTVRWGGLLKHSGEGPDWKRCQVLSDLG